MLELRPPGGLTVPSFATRGAAASQGDVDTLEGSAVYDCTTSGTDPAHLVLTTGLSITPVIGNSFVFVPNVNLSAGADVVIDGAAAVPLLESNGTAIDAGDILGSHQYFATKRSSGLRITGGNDAAVITLESSAVYDCSTVGVDPAHLILTTGLSITPVVGQSFVFFPPVTLSAGADVVIDGAVAVPLLESNGTPNAAGQIIASHQYIATKRTGGLRITGGDDAADIAELQSHRVFACTTSNSDPNHLVLSTGQNVTLVNGMSVVFVPNVTMNPGADLVLDSNAAVPLLESNGTPIEVDDVQLSHQIWAIKRSSGFRIVSGGSDLHIINLETAVAELQSGVGGEVTGPALNAILDRQPGVYGDDRELDIAGGGDFTTFLNSYANATNVTGGVPAGEFLLPNRVRIEPGLYPHIEMGGMGAVLPQYLRFEGRERANTRIRGATALNADASVYNSRSVHLVWYSADYVGYRIEAKGLRYCMHPDGGAVVDQTLRLLDMTMIHEGNADHQAWKVANNPGGTDWYTRNRPLGLGMYSGWQVVIDGGLYAGYEYVVGGHDNQNFSKPARFEARNCELRITGNTNIKRAVICTAHGSDQHNRWKLENIKTNGDIEFLINAGANQIDADLYRNTVDMTIAGCSPLAAWIVDSQPRAFQIRSNTATGSSSIVIGGMQAAIDALFGTVFYSPVGSSGLAPYAWGYHNIVALGGGTQSLGSRLGNRTSSPWTMTVAVDGGAAQTINIASNYTAMSNAAVISALQTGLTGATIAELNLCERYRPEMLSEELLLRPNGNGIAWRKWAAFDTSKSLVKLAVAADAVDRMAGAVWGGDLWAGEQSGSWRNARVKETGLFTSADIIVTTGTPAIWDSLSIDGANPGQFVISATKPVLRCIRTAPEGQVFERV